ncbi:MAG: hypothetical protein ABWY00_09265 [Dongiaceae bacterium]
MAMAPFKAVWIAIKVDGKVSGTITRLGESAISISVPSKSRNNAKSTDGSGGRLDEFQDVICFHLGQLAGLRNHQSICCDPAHSHHNGFNQRNEPSAAIT